MLRGVRGATTVDENEREAVVSRTQELLRHMTEANGIQTDDVGAVIFSATPDITAAFPASSARLLGWTEVPLFDARQMDCDNSLPLCIRVLILWNTDKEQRHIRHTYLHGARLLRPDLAR